MEEIEVDGFPFPLLTIWDAAARVGVSEFEIEDAIEEGRLPFYNLGRIQVRLRRDEVDRVFAHGVEVGSHETDGD